MDNQNFISEQISPTPTPAAEKPKDWFKISLIFIGFLIVLGLFGNIYLLLRKEKPKPISEITPTPTPTQIIVLSTPTPDSTADWKTYTNTKHNYLLRYPPGFTFVEGPAAGSPPEVFQTWDTISFDSSEFGLSVHVNPTDAHGKPIACSTDEECKSKLLAVLQKASSETTPFSSTVFEKVRTGFKYEITNPLYTTYSHYLIFLEDGKLWEISIYNQDGFSDYSLVNQILSTFKFLQ